MSNVKMSNELYLYIKLFTVLEVFMQQMFKVWSSTPNIWKKTLMKVTNMKLIVPILTY